MGGSETAHKNHEALFPNRKSTLMVTDPELIEVFDNFAFDEVLGYGNLDTRTRSMVILASISRDIYRLTALVTILREKAI